MRNQVLRKQSLAAATALYLLLAGVVLADHPLRPLDTSSPRATLASFLAGTEEVGRCYVEYRASPGQATQAALIHATNRVVRLLDLSDVPQASRLKTGTEAYTLLWEVVARVPLPDPAEIPGRNAGEGGEGATSPPTRWRVPGTEITIARVEEGPRAGEFLFSPETVRRAQEFFEAARALPYQRPVPIENLHQVDQLLTGWLIPMAWVEALPDWANTSVLGQVLWKWLCMLLLGALACGAVTGVLYWSRRKRSDDSLRSHARRLSTPLAILATGAVTRYLLEEQLNVTGIAATGSIHTVEVAFGAAWVWIIWLTADWTAGAIIASPRISRRSVDAQLIRLGARCVGFVAAAVLMFRVAAALGIPVYGLVAGAGVGGITVALAAKNTLENFLGALHIFADRPIRVGDLCRYDDDHSQGWRPIGRVESIGLRSTRIRDFDRGLVSIPNADLAQRHITNLSACDRMLFDIVFGVRYETTHDQLRYLLAQLRELLHAHPRVIHTKKDPLRVRFVGFGDCALNIELRAYIRATERHEFLAIQEDILLHCMQVVKRAGTSFAFPSRTLYYNRDDGLDQERQREVEEKVEAWAATQSLPFPDLADDVRERITDTLSFPPEGSPGAAREDEKV